MTSKEVATTYVKALQPMKIALEYKTSREGAVRRVT